MAETEPDAFRFNGCNDEERYALSASDMAESSTGVALGTAIITSMLAVISGARSSGDPFS